MSSCSAASRREAPPSTCAITSMRMSAEYAFGIVRPQTNQCRQTRPFTGPWESCDSIRPEHALVLVTAHVDSTAANSPPYDETADKAPGADDDASGIAAVLTVAEVIAGLTGSTPPRRTIRFVLFNAEEEGLVGSRAYARLQRARQASVACVFQM